MFGNKLNATIAKVTSFITDLEKGIEENEAQIAKNTESTVKARSAAKEKALKIKEDARAKATKTVEKAETGVAKAIQTTAELRDQNAVAKRLLGKLK